MHQSVHGTVVVDETEFEPMGDAVEELEFEFIEPQVFDGDWEEGDDSGAEEEGREVEYDEENWAGGEAEEYGDEEEEQFEGA